MAYESGVLVAQHERASPDALENRGRGAGGILRHHQRSKRLLRHSRIVEMRENKILARPRLEIDGLVHSRLRRIKKLRGPRLIHPGVCLGDGRYLPAPECAE